MAKIKLANSTKGKNFVFDSSVSWRENINFNIVKMPLAGEDETATKVVSILSPTRIIIIDFKLTGEQHDYTDGTGTPTTYSPLEKKKWLLDNVCKAESQYFLYDQGGNMFEGILESVDISIVGEKPLEIEGSIRFMVADNIS